SKAVSLEDLFSHMQEGAIKELALVIKADVQGSVEAAVDEISKIHHDEVVVQVIHSGVGGIVASDIMLAAASNAIVVGFNVRPNAEARALADREGVDIRTYRVIYQLTEDIQQALIGMLSPEKVEEVLGEVEVRQTFRASRVGTIAGCMVTQGSVQRGAQVRIVRDGTIVHDGRIGTLKRFQEDVREVAQGFECGLTIDGYNDIKEGDILEVYAVREVARSA
ncbi:MAG TPA: EF-Tu/IF-2/RF-3 family GTPase, partial [Gaiellales bacterium]|nr:EF-Tu/IF-2/RF-3 family GTPase [Gaiellales bacterium]